MKTSRLYIYVNNGWSELDLDTTPAINYQANTLTDIQDRQATYSQQISLPMTSNNLRLFDFVGLEYSLSEAPYSLFPCRYYEGGLDVLGGSFSLYIISVTETINVQIVSSVKDLFTLLSEVEAEPSDFPKIQWTFENVPGHIDPSVDELYKFCLLFPSSTDEGRDNPLGETTKFIKLDNPDNPNADKTPAALHWVRPLLNYRMIVETMFQKTGYTIETDLFTRSYYKDLYYLMPSLTIDSDEDVSPLSGYTQSATQQISPSDFSPRFFYFISSDMKEGYNNLKPDTIRYEDYDEEEDTTQYEQGVSYVAPNKMTLRVEVSITLEPTTAPGGFTAVFKVYTLKPGRGKPVSGAEETFGTTNVTESESVIGGGVTGAAIQNVFVELEESDRCFVSIQIKDLDTAGEVYVPVKASVNFTVLHIAANAPNSSTEAEPEIINSNALPGGTIPIYNNLGFSDFSVMFKEFIQLYNLNVYIDNDNKTVKLFTFDKTIETTPMDWSKKVSRLRSDRETTYNLDNYAQTNNINLTANGSYIDRGAFYIENATLSMQADLLTLSFTSVMGENYRIVTDTNILTASTGDYSVSEYGSTRPGVYFKNYNYSGGSKKLIHLSDDSYNVPVVSARGSSTIQTLSLPIGVKDDIQSIITNSFSSLANRILYKCRYIKIKVLLLSSDLYDLNLYAPVLIKPFNSLFYIRRIANRQGNTLTDVELIEIKK